MSAYLVVDISDLNPSEMAEYGEAVGPLVVAHGGSVLAADENPMVLEGQWNNRILLLSFPSKKHIHDFFSSPEYAPLKERRRKNSIGRSVAFDALPEA